MRTATVAEMRHTVFALKDCRRVCSPASKECRQSAGQSPDPVPAAPRATLTHRQLDGPNAAPRCRARLKKQPVWKALAFAPLSMRPHHRAVLAKPAEDICLRRRDVAGIFIRGVMQPALFSNVE